MLRLDHHPRFRPIRRARFGRLAKLGFFALGMPVGSFCSIDVTARCNLRCKHCYFLEQGYERSQELTVDEWEALLSSLRRRAWPRPYFAFQCSWVGGEPLLRKEVIERCRRFFPFNIVVTNGTIPLPDWRDVHFFVSVDGTREAHEAIRGTGTYDRIRANADRPDLDVMVTYCINRLNAHCIEEFVAEWDASNVRHVAFEFHTPVRGLAADAELALSPQERDRILTQLLELKRIYRHFILPPARTYRLMRSDRCRAVTDRCQYRRAAFVFGPDGRRKFPCMLGPKVDCDRCGCIIPFVTEAQVNRVEILRDLWDELVGARLAAGHF
jgi:MoaA/NifB/PqqE/SkfB family radical SAM enzyme